MAVRSAATGRDRGIDGIRAYAIAGVVLGHWLVTALVRQPDGTLTTASPLAAMPALVPATWLCQTLGLFFFTAGYGSGRSLDRAAADATGYRAWMWRRLGRLVPAVGVLLGGTAVVLAGAGALGVSPATRWTVAGLLVSPLWFLLPFTVLVGFTGVLRRLLTRYGLLVVALPGVVTVAASDLIGRGPAAVQGGWRTPPALLAAWLVPYLMGLRVAGGGLSGRRTGWALLLGAAAGMAWLTLLAGYPASAVGVPGAGRSNLNPPSLFVVCLATAQVGVALLIRPVLTRLLRGRRWWSPVRRLNAVAATGYLWHQPVLVGVTLLVAMVAAGRAVPGLHTVPDDAGWLAARLVWLPLFGVVLTAVVAMAPTRYAAASRVSAG